MPQRLVGGGGKVSNHPGIISATVGTSPLKHGLTTGSFSPSLPWKGLVTIMEPVTQEEDKGQKQQGENSLVLRRGRGAGQGTRQRHSHMRSEVLEAKFSVIRKSQKTQKEPSQSLPGPLL